MTATKPTARRALSRRRETGEVRRGRPPARRALALGALALLGGCSWLLMDPAPAEDPAALPDPPRCTESEGWPIWDTALGSSSVVVGGLQLAVAHDTDRPWLSRTLGVANLAAGGVYIASALIGYRRADQCSSARDAYFDIEQ